MNDAFNELTVQLTAIWRRRWYALAIAWLVCLAGWVYVTGIPDKYRSTARLYIDTTSLLGPLLRGIAISIDLNQEVRLMQRTLLSRPNLAEVARATDLDLEATTPLEIENMIKRLKKNAEISSQGQNLFSVSYIDKDPVLAKAIVQALLTIFVETNLGRNRQDMENARSFIESQIEVYQQQLRDSERRIADFKAKHADVLQTGGFAARLRNARKSETQKRRAYEDAISRRDQLKEQLAKVPQFLKIQAPPQIVLAARGALSPLNARLQKMEGNLDLLMMRYTENHPDVISQKRAIDNLQTLLVERQSEESDDSPQFEWADTPKAEIPNALYQQLELKISDLEPQFFFLRRALSDASAEVSRLDDLRLIAPEIEIQQKDLDRDYGIIKGKFNEFLSRRESARISQAAEATSDTIQFRIISPPEVPLVPSAPNRKVLFAMVLVAGLGGGFGFSFLLGQIDATVGTGRKLQEHFGFPVIGNVSLITSSRRNIRKILGNVSFGMALGTLLALCAVLVLFASQLVNLPELLKQQTSLPQLAWAVEFVTELMNSSFLKGK